MEEVGEMDEKAVMLKELGDGIELAKELRSRMLISSSSSDFMIQSLVDKMLSSFDRSISLAKSLKFDGYSHSPPSFQLSSPATPSPFEPHLSLSRKRKKMALEIKLVKVSPHHGLVSGLEGPLNDGFSWRKYGQKDILKAKYPRGYYRCTHRHSQGCAATKHIQRLDEDPSIYQVIYKGEHTCTTVAHFSQAHKKPNTAQMNTMSQQQHNQQQVPSDLGPKFEPTNPENEAQIFNPFSLNEAQIEPGLFEDYMLSSSPEFWSPPTLESDYLPAGFGLGLNVQKSESDISESMSGLSSATNSPNVGHFEFAIDDEFLPDIDLNFSFDCEPLLCKM